MNKPRATYDAQAGEWVAKGELRSLENPATPLSYPDDWLVDLLGGRNVSGVRVSEESSLSFSTIYACVLVIAETMAQLPLEVRRRDGRNITAARDNYLWSKLHDAPNNEQTSFDWRMNRWVNQLLWGNAYDWVQFDRGGRVNQVIPLAANRTFAERSGGELFYRHYGSAGEQVILEAGEVMHTKGISLDGLNGMSVIGMQRETVGSGIATRDYGSKVFSSGFLNGVIEYPGHFADDQAYREFTRRWGTTYTGNNNAGKTAVLERGMKFQAIGMPAKDAQFIEARKYNRAEIASLFRVPLSMIQDLEHSGVRANIEQQDTNFAKHTIAPHAIRAEQEMHRKLLTTPAERSTLEIRFNLDGLMRGDSKTRSEYYASGIQFGWMKRSYAAEAEGISLTEDEAKTLDVYLAPVNMMDAAAMEADTTTDTEQNDETRSSVPPSLLRSLSDMCNKVLEREAKALTRIATTATSTEEFVTQASRLLEQQEAYMRRNLSPLLDIAAEVSCGALPAIDDAVSEYRAGLLSCKDFDPDGVAAFSAARQFTIG